MNVRILESARRDLLHGYIFYEKQQEGVGEYFWNTLFAEIDNLAKCVGIHPVRLGYHRMLSSRFPYAVYYRIEANEAVVHAVLDCRRDPNWIKRQLK
jgi:plasmid stabilization system protein ParE